MDPKKMLLIKGEPKTLTVKQCHYERSVGKYVVKYKNSDREYQYAYKSVEWLSASRVLSGNYIVKHNGFTHRDVISITSFSNGFNNYYRIFFESSPTLECAENEVVVVESCLNQKSQSVLEYFKEISSMNELVGDDGRSLLSMQFDNISFIANYLSIAPYLSPGSIKVRKLKHKDLFFPFGLNRSQLAAVRNAFESQISVVQGPPGTGKTQTILTIIANILKAGKTVLVVSNNNSAIMNVQEKLEKYGFGFLVAVLGRAENKEALILEQKNGRKIPNDAAQWKNFDIDTKQFTKAYRNKSEEIQKHFEGQEHLKIAQSEYEAVLLEWQHFKDESGLIPYEKSKIPSKVILELLVGYDEGTTLFENGKLHRIRDFVKYLKYRYLYKIDNKFLKSNPTDDTIQLMQVLYYQQKCKELKNEIQELKDRLSRCDSEKAASKINEMSMQVLKNAVFDKHISRHKNITITKDTLYKNPEAVLKEFPIVLSTTFSARNSLPKAEFDYVIMDEASQVSADTGILAMMCAKNAVIVGDVMQLPNVITEEQRIKLDNVFQKYNIAKGYDCSCKSFLQSIIEILPDVPQTLLREHYRCAPKIINFCNQKFYGGDLIIMTDENTSEKPIVAIKTAKGNHSRDHMNQREADVICREILPFLNCPKKEIGIITPYNSQVDAISRTVGNEIEVATVHKFQGREKDVIIMSVVDDQISEFADDPNLLNVAVSRAKKYFYLVVSGNEQTLQGNICDLLGYIDYQCNSITNSNIHSVFDLLYKSYAQIRSEYLKRHKRISEFDSENIMYALLNDIICSDNRFASLDVLCHYPLNNLIRDYSPLTPEEQAFASNRLSHLDFLIYNKVNKKPVLAIEVDGWAFHKKGSRQYYRDEIKNSILPKYGIKLLRMSTTGSSEREKILLSLQGE